MKDKYKKYNQSQNNGSKIKNTMTIRASIFNTLKCLFSNQAVIDGRFKSVFFTIVLALILVVISWIPPLSTGYTTQSAKFLLGAANNGIDHGFKMMFNEEYFKGIGIDGDKGNGIISFDKQLLEQYSEMSNESVINELEKFTNEKALAKGTFVDSATKKVEYSEATGQILTPNPNVLNKYSEEQFTFYTDSLRTNKRDVLDNETKIDGDYLKDYTVFLEVYLVPGLKSTDSAFNQFVGNLLTTLIYRPDDNSKAQKYPHSFAFICDDCIRISTFQINNVSKEMTASGNYVGFTKKAFIHGTDAKTLYNYIYTQDPSRKDGDAYNDFVSLLNQAAKTTNVTNAWIFVGIMSGVSIGSFFLCALIIFLMERRKASIVKSNFGQAIVQGVSICTTPALLSLFGFISLAYGILAFAGFGLLRCLFMNTKIAPPANVQESKPLYQARTK